MRGFLVVLISVALPAWSAAQSAPPTLRDNDTIIAIGWAGSEHQIHEQREWHGSLLVAFRGGHYWTDHLKTDVEASWNSPRERGVYETIERLGGYTYALADYRADDIRVGISQLYQFGRNAWVHPYVGAGVDVVRREASIDRLPQSRTIYLQNRNVPVDIPALTERKTTVFAQAVLRTGLKMYVTERAFFNTDLKFGVRRDVDHLVWKLGMGFDF
jgi:opacity protein-like surface antigen